MSVELGKRHRREGSLWRCHADKPLYFSLVMYDKVSRWESVTNFIRQKILLSCLNPETITFSILVWNKVTKHIGSIVCLVWSQQTATPEFVTPCRILEGCTWPICRSAAAWTNIALKYWVNITIVVFRSPRRLNTEIYFCWLVLLWKAT